MAKPRQAPERPMPSSEAELEKEIRMPARRDVHRPHRRTHAETTPEDATGINPEKMRPIDPRMVYIPPA
ncbi:MAG: hypothetical protein AB7U82_06945 [Blastocatellales bacterium]